MARQSINPEGGDPRGNAEVEPPEPKDQSMTAQRLRWDDICRLDEFRGRWVALDECRYDEDTGRATEGAVVDVDEDLVTLCARIRESERTNCAILFAGEEPPGAQKH
jgi:hypothetical protein